MANILLYIAKRALIDALDSLLSSDTVQVGYSYPPEPLRQCVYGGGARMTQVDAVAEPGVTTVERVVVDIYIRCQVLGDDSRAAEMLAEMIADKIIGMLNATPYLVTPTPPGGVTVVGIVQGIADSPILSGIPEPVIDVSLLLQISCEGTI